MTDDSDNVLKTLIFSLCFLLPPSPFTVMIIVDVAWLTLGVYWLINFYMTVQIGEAREIMLGKYKNKSAAHLLLVGGLIYI